MNKKRFLNSPVRRAALIVLLSLASAVIFNQLRPSAFPWDWKPAPPSASQIDDLAIFQSALSRPETVLVDARDEIFYEIGHIPGAVCLPLESADQKTIETWRAALPPEAEVIVYCSDEFCSMASELAERMTAAGLKPSIFSPGFQAWEERGLPVETVDMADDGDEE